MKKKRPDPEPFQHKALLMPCLGLEFSRWRKVLKGALLTRDKVCRGCGEVFLRAPHMHEGLVSRAQAMGWPSRWRILLHCELNCILLCRECNLGLSGKSPPPRNQVWTEHCAIYGENVMRAWLESLPFKNPPRF